MGWDESLLARSDIEKKRRIRRSILVPHLSSQRPHEQAFLADEDHEDHNPLAPDAMGRAIARVFLPAVCAEPDGQPGVLFAVRHVRGLSHGAGGERHCAVSDGVDGICVVSLEGGWRGVAGSASSYRGFGDDVDFGWICAVHTRGRRGMKKWGKICAVHTRGRRGMKKWGKIFIGEEVHTRGRRGMKKWGKILEESTNQNHRSEPFD